VTSNYAIKAASVERLDSSELSSGASASYFGCFNMKNIIRNLILCLSLPLLVTACAVSSNSTDIGYHPNTNPVADLAHAKDLASTNNKKILIIAGGDWCRWCHALNEFLDDNGDVHNALDKTFVIVKVYVGEDNMNEEFFSKLPSAKGYPHFWVLSNKGELIASVNTGDLEHGNDSYNKAKFLKFISTYNAP
jgi:thioredoxin-related protein